MSVLAFPRIYFTGFMSWDPATSNNNDYFPTYDDVQVSLNWEFFQKNKINITPDNFGTTFRDWDINFQTVKGYNNDRPAIPGEWNYFGGNGCNFVQYVDPGQQIDRRSLVTGGALDHNKQAGNDPMLGKPVTWLGDPFGDPAPRPPGRLVDVNPVSSYSSQIYYNSIVFGDTKLGIVAPRAYRMQSRFVNFTRNFNIGAAGGASVTWQASFPADQGLKINAGQSPLLKALQAKIASGEAQGIMVRFNTYLNLYYQNGYFNDFRPRPQKFADLPSLYRDALKTGNLFSNPCYSRVVGVIGPWYDGELATAPEGRYLAAPDVPDMIYLCNPRAASPCWGVPAAPQSITKGGPLVAGPGPSPGKNPLNPPAANLKAAAQLGVAIAEVDYKSSVISIDLLNTFPEWYFDGEKVDFKSICIGAQSGDVVTPIATLPYTPTAKLPLAGYRQGAYEASGGIVDLPFDPALAQAIRDGVLVFQVQSDVWVAKQISPNPPTYQQVATRTVMTETPVVAQTDQRGIYINEGEGSELQVSIKDKGKPAAGAYMLVVKYNPPDVGGDPPVPIPAQGDQVVNIVNGQSRKIMIDLGNGKSVETVATTVQADKNGMASLVIQSESPGFPVLVFYPYLSGQTPPAPLAVFNESLTSMFTSIRVMSFDDAFVDQFVQLWNSTYDAAKAWDFVYSNILYLYDMIFPVMLKFVPLNERQRVELAIDQVLALVAPSYFPESTLAMPITRDLSQGKRTVLELWGGLVKRNYPPQPITKPSPATE